jgi:SAM-dependent methyltransferase
MENRPLPWRLARTAWHSLQLVAYRLGGRRPWSRGYTVHRRRTIESVLAAGRFDPDALPPGYGLRLDERVVEYAWMFSRLPRGGGRLLDAGSVLNFDFLLGQPALAEKTLAISTLAPEPFCFWNRGISYVFEDLRHSGFRDGLFDWVVSLSTVEHIGLDNAMLYSGDAGHRENRPDTYLEAIREFARVLRPGGTLLLSVPYGRHANHGWFQVFDAPMVDALVAAFAPSRSREWIFRYLPEGWVRSNRADAADATYFDIHARRDYDPDFAAASRAVVCLELTR